MESHPLTGALQDIVRLSMTILMLETKIVPCRKASVTVLLMALMPTHQDVETDRLMVSEEAVRMVDASV
jgi:hypothetical protein